MLFRILRPIVEKHANAEGLVPESYTVDRGRMRLQFQTRVQYTPGGASGPLVASRERSNLPTPFSVAPIQRPIPVVVKEIQAMATPPTSPVKSKPRFRYLEQLARGIDQLHHETEQEAKQILEKDLSAAYSDKDEVMGMARQRLADHKGAIGDFRDQMETIKEQLSGGGSNSGEHQDQKLDAKTEEQIIKSEEVGDLDEVILPEAPSVGSKTS